MSTVAPNRCTGITQRTLRTEVALDDLRRQQVRVGVDVHQPRRGAHGADGLGGGDERVGRHDHLVAGADLERPQRERERLGARGDADGELRLAVGRELPLEPLDGLAERERAALGDAANERPAAPRAAPGRRSPAA